MHAYVLVLSCSRFFKVNEVVLIMKVILKKRKKEKMLSGRSISLLLCFLIKILLSSFLLLVEGCSHMDHHYLSTNHMTSCGQYRRGTRITPFYIESQRTRMYWFCLVRAFSKSTKLSLSGRLF